MIFGLILMSTLAGVTVAANNRPIIGVLAQETGGEVFEKYGDSYFYSDYVKFVELAGGRAVPIMIDKPDEYYTEMFKNINGVLFPGGGADILTSGYAKAAQQLYKLAIQENDAGDRFPLLGICLGFQLLTALTSGKNVLTECDTENISLRLLKYDPQFSSSRLFSSMTNDMETMVTKWNVTSNFHHECLTPKSFEDNEDLNSFYTALSHNYDKKGLDFISTIEGKKYPFYGTQWHPEKNIYHYELTDNVNHSLGAIQVTQYIANFFVNEARKSQHTFISIDKEVDSLIDNYQSLFMGLPSLHDIYFFNLTEGEESYLDEGFDWIGFHVSERCKRGLKIMLMMFVMVVVTVTMGVFLRRWLQVNNQNMTYQHILSLSQRYAMLDHGMDDSRLPKTTFPPNLDSYNNAPEKVSIAVPD